MIERCLESDAARRPESAFGSRPPYLAAIPSRPLGRRRNTGAARRRRRRDEHLLSPAAALARLVVFGAAVVVLLTVTGVNVYSRYVAFQ